MPPRPRLEPGDPPPIVLPHTWRPLGPRIAGAVAAGALVVVVAFLWIGLDAQTKASISLSERLTTLAVFVLGGVCLYALTRSKAVATRTGLVVVNGYKRHEFVWAQIVAVHLRPGQPWVTLDLTDGETASVMGIQGSDGRRARDAVRQLRDLVDAPHGPQPPGD